MADQVNPLGSLAPGLPPTLPVPTVPATAIRLPSVPETTLRPPLTQAPVPQGPDGKGPSAPGVSPEQTLGAAVQDVKTYLQQLPSELRFGVDKGSGSFYFKVVDPATREVIRQVPSEEVLAMARKLREFANPKTASGVLMDKEG